ncbi:MAG: hypothetical protein ABR970_20440 [Roseiarcus sp.]|jgi:hypothetical protein
MKSILTAAALILAGLGGAQAATATTPPTPDATKAADPASLRQHVQDNLAKAGFTDIKVMPESFLVRAKDQQGNPVMMVINPDSFTEVTTIAGKSASAATGKEEPGASTTKK